MWPSPDDKMGNLFTRLNSYRLRMKNLTDVFEGRVPKVLIIGLDGAGKQVLFQVSPLTSCFDRKELEKTHRMIWLRQV